MISCISFTLGEITHKSTRRCSVHGHIFKFSRSLDFPPHTSGCARGWRSPVTTRTELLRTLGVFNVHSCRMNPLPAPLRSSQCKISPEHTCVDTKHRAPMQLLDRQLFNFSKRTLSSLPIRNNRAERCLTLSNTTPRAKNYLLLGTTPNAHS